MIHAEYAFDTCRQQIVEYEDCRQTDTPLPRNPFECREKARAVVNCYKEK
jgi:Cytochrome c oxidase biogenesis protein Cmc1 like.